MKRKRRGKEVFRIIIGRKNERATVTTYHHREKKKTPQQKNKPLPREPPILLKEWSREYSRATTTTPMAENQNLHPPSWETSKENVEPLKSGRNVTEMEKNAKLGKEEKEEKVEREKR